MYDLVGKNVLIRTVSYFYTGRIVEITKKAIRLETAAWIADTGRFADSLKSCDFAEVEPYSEDCWVMLGAVVDITTIKTLPTAQK